MVNSDEVSHRCRRTPAPSASSSKECQQATIALRGDPVANVSRCCRAPATIVSASRAGASSGSKSTSAGSGSRWRRLQSRVSNHLTAVSSNAAIKMPASPKATIVTISRSRSLPPPLPRAPASSPVGAPVADADGESEGYDGGLP